MPELLKAVEEVLPDAQVYVFGSALRDELTAGSDIDILIISDACKGERRYGLALAIEDRLSGPEVFELHMGDRAALEWYRKHAKELAPLQAVVSGQHKRRRGPRPASIRRRACTTIGKVVTTLK